MPEGWRQRGVTPYRGQGQRPRVPGCDSTGKAKRSYPASEVRAGDKRSYPASEVRGGRRDELPRVRGRGSGQESQAATAQEHPRGDTLRPRSGLAIRGVTLRRRSGVAARRSYPTTKERWQCRRRRA